MYLVFGTFCDPNGSGTLVNVFDTADELKTYIKDAAEDYFDSLEGDGLGSRHVDFSSFTDCFSYLVLEEHWVEVVHTNDTCLLGSDDLLQKCRKARSKKKTG